MIPEAVISYKHGLMSYLQKELAQNGSYQEWYDDLADFRQYMMERYVRNHYYNDLFIHRAAVNKFGDILDHHLISYQAPLDFTRIGWGGKQFTPIEQILKLSDWIVMGGVDLFMSLCPIKGLFILS